MDLDPAWDVAFRDERAVEVSSRYNSIHCGACHRQSPLGSFRCGFCNFKFLTASERDRARPVPKPRDLGLDRDMWYDLGRDPAREAERVARLTPDLKRHVHIGGRRRRSSPLPSGTKIGNIA